MANNVNVKSAQNSTNHLFYYSNTKKRMTTSSNNRHFPKYERYFINELFTNSVFL